MGSCALWAKAECFVGRPKPGPRGSSRQAAGKLPAGWQHLPAEKSELPAAAGKLPAGRSEPGPEFREKSEPCVVAQF